MNYKKIFRNQNLRFRILSSLKFIPDKVMLKLQYYIKLGRIINWRKPSRFTEWLQWYKVNYRNPIMFQCVDKYEVRKYLADKGLNNILIRNYGVYNNPDQIDFKSLPKKFVIKTTDGGGGENVIICRDKNNIDIEDTKRKLMSWKDRKDINAGREWAYTGIKKSRIVIEELLENTSNPDSGVEDYKILCFGGKPSYIIYDCDRYIDHKRNIYNTKWERIYVDTDCKQKDQDIPSPKNLAEMLEIASILSNDFPFVRVDLYNIVGKIYFGELTFYPWSGYVSFNPDSFDYELGEKFSETIKNLNKDVHIL